jgi:ATP-dependent DNA ligase
MHARIVSGAAALLTRNGLDWTAKYPNIAAAIGALKRRQAYLDGELFAVRPDGTTSFSALQGHGDTPAELVYFAFDLLHLDGEEWRGCRCSNAMRVLKPYSLSVVDDRGGL